MRAIFLATLLVAVTSAPAGACPRSATCAAIGLRAPIDLKLPKRDPIQLAFRFVVESRPDPQPMPWIWQVLRRGFYDHMPRYAGERRFSLTLSPVVVASAFDTVPGLGVEGEF